MGIQNLEGINGVTITFSPAKCGGVEALRLKISKN